MALKLYDHPLSPYGQKVKIALIEKGVEFTGTLPNAIGSGQVDAAFAAANPRGEVPALLDGDAAIFDSTIILQYIEDKWPTPALLPAAPIDRARVRMLEEVMDTHFEGITWALSEIRNFGRAEGAEALRLEAAGAAELSRWHQWLESQLGKRRWFNGETFGTGDLCVIPFVNGAASFGHVPWPGSALADWHARANARDSVRKVHRRSRDDGDAGRERRHGGRAPGAAGGTLQARIPRPSARMDDPQRRDRRGRAGTRAEEHPFHRTVRAMTGAPRRPPHR